jgi:hypothetical protein
MSLQIYLATLPMTHETPHRPWPLQDATAEIRSNTMTMPLHIALPTRQPVLHFARYLDVVAWRVVPLVE